LNLGGIAKGYAVDRAVGVLKERKIAAALVSDGAARLTGSVPARERRVERPDPVHSRPASYIAHSRRSRQLKFAALQRAADTVSLMNSREVRTASVALSRTPCGQIRKTAQIPGQGR
jgi:hypothetical protein